MEFFIVCSLLAFARIRVQWVLIFVLLLLGLATLGITLLVRVAVAGRRRAVGLRVGIRIRIRRIGVRVRRIGGRRVRGRRAVLLGLAARRRLFRLQLEALGRVAQPLAKTLTGKKLLKKQDENASETTQSAKDGQGCT